LEEFGRRKPIVVEKRIGKICNQPVYVHFDENFIKEFSELNKIK
jgi:hypothetical protein